MKQQPKAPAPDNSKSGKRRTGRGKGRLAKRMTGPPGHREAVARANDLARIAARREVAWDLFCKSATIRQIAKATGVSAFTAHGDVCAYFEALEAQQPVTAAHIRARHQAEVDTLKRANWPTALSGKTAADRRAAADTILGALNREARLHGLDRQQAAYSLEQVMGLVRSATLLFLEVVEDGALRQRFAAGLRRKVPALLAGAIEAGAPGTAPEPDGNIVGP